MFELGPKAFYIWSCYGITFLVFLFLVIWVYWSERQQRKILGQLEAQGMKARSQQNKKQ